jgi:small conductance mechanosensitive channel
MRSKTRPGEQWGIRREFLRRIKLKFDELGIEIPFPHQTIYWGSDKSGKAPPLRIETNSRELRQAAAEDAEGTPPEDPAEGSGPEPTPSTIKPPGKPANTADAPPATARQVRAGGD